jgi:sugar phosphate isomerase/epimerase
VRIDRDGALHLTYCTNIHAADGWTAVDANVRRYAPALKRRFSPDRPFGIGLRLSARDARELAAGDALDTFRAWLDAEGLYVAIINGFPFGSFHRSVVKADVYAPDWRDEARVAYTLDLARILSRLVPAGVDGGVSTAPLSYKAWLASDDEAGWATVTDNVVRVAVALARTRRDEGTFIHLDIEPEPDCSIETSAETIEFFERRLLPRGVPRVAGELGVSEVDAREILLDHIRVCFDCCHFAVEHENPVEALGRLSRAGIRVGRIQLSSALCVDMPADPDAAAQVEARLRPFADSTYLHQVVARDDGRLEHFPDLGPALDTRPAGAAEWRIHFHVPLFTREYQGLGSSQEDVRRVIQAAAAQPITTHLEIETYTWDVLPTALKLDLLESIGREYEWVLGNLKGNS